MSKPLEFIRGSVPDFERGFQLLERLFAVASTEAVYSQPYQSGEYTVITASELSVGLGFGIAGGSGGDAGVVDEGEAESAGVGGYGGGTGGGGGGGSTSRPVAAIEIGPNGVRIEPIVDITKIAVAFVTMIASLMITQRRLR